LLEGQLVAIAATERAYLSPDMARLPRGDPRRRMTAALCLYTRDVERRIVPGPWSAAAAELYARCLLICDEDFNAQAFASDEWLADRYGVPVDQVVRKREDLRRRGAVGAGQGPSGAKVSEAAPIPR